MEKIDTSYEKLLFLSRAFGLDEKSWPPSEGTCKEISDVLQALAEEKKHLLARNLQLVQVSRLERVAQEITEIINNGTTTGETHEH